MKFSTRTRYGLRALIDLGVYYQGKPVLVKEIAKRQNLSERYLEHIMLALKKSGILRSIKGGKGGYMFLKEPSEIKISEIIEILEGSLSPVECVEKKEICKKSEYCVARELWCEIKSEILKYLEGITLKQLIERQKKKNQSGKNIVFYEI
ncbi:MAG: Rrf2 family transcriptional regulator [Candidatus Omnitrophica bacterium]|nr:Rrf2 family transcriptional regulator [Candidatus Omnitrophota bacterium]MCM8810041.1 Rrf2 family transcriptional regulator [Candidatus Omnitrophota bacterium]